MSSVPLSTRQLSVRIDGYLQPAMKLTEAVELKDLVRSSEGAATDDTGFSAGLFDSPGKESVWAITSGVAW